jgi:hypothetical protein
MVIVGQIGCAKCKNAQFFVYLAANEVELTCAECGGRMYINEETARHIS